MRTVIKSRLLAPAGDIISLRAALDAGADEIFFGIRGFNMRVAADNFEMKDLKKISSLCKKYSAKAFLAINTIIYDSEQKQLAKIIKKAKSAGIDAVIAWDMSVISECQNNGIDIHLSTQASASNLQSIKFFKKAIPSLKRVVLARECTLVDVKKIIAGIQKEKLGVEIEAFIHGAMCVSISGRCFMSQEIFGKSANRGECLQPCRRLYSVTSKSSDQKMCNCSLVEPESKKVITDVEEGFQFELGRDYVMSPKDLCALPFIDQLVEAGISSFKIEGRARSPEYVKTVVSSYRNVLDYYFENKSKISKSQMEKNKFEKIKKEQMDKLATVYNRGFSNGFYFGKPVSEWCKSYGSQSTTTKEYVGRVLNFYPKNSVAEIKLESTGINVGDSLMIQGVTTGVLNQNAESIQVNGKNVDSAAKGSKAGLKISQKVRMNDKVYRIIKKEK